MRIGRSAICKLWAVGSLGILFVPNLWGASLPTGFTEAVVASGISSPTAMAFAPDGRLFVCQQGGQLRVIKNGSLLATPFVSVPVDSAGERGLLGVAFDPDFASNQYVFVYYTVNTSPRFNRISRFTANGDVAVPGSEALILQLNNLTSATNHNGGAIHFGPDGKLYVAAGDNATSSNAQTLGNLLGKMLRLNADGSIPNDNPFFNSATGVNRAIWTLGLRNPFTFAFQPGTGRMFINDVGQSSWEEINDGIAGSNYGWPSTEGVTANPAYRSPLYAYGHGTGPATGCAITGGAFYNPPVNPFPLTYLGQYFFADYCSGWIRTYNPSTGGVAGFATGISSPVDLKTGADGNLYYLSRGSGSVFRVWYSATQAPQVTAHPSSVTVSVGQPATFSVSASGTAPLSSQWQRNSANISAATSASYTLSPATMADNGAQFRCVITNGFGSAVSNTATLTVIQNQPPLPVITNPVAGTRYSGGMTISYAGSATDPEDGPLPASAFSWQVDLHHDTHTHPFQPAASGSTSGSFTIPVTGETSANVWYRVHLTVRDSAGQSVTVFRDVTPQTATMQFQTLPPGLNLTLDGQPIATPALVTGVVGIQRTIAAPSPQSVAGVTYEFSQWSDGGAASHSISTPSVDTTYTAVFRIAGTGSRCDLDVNGQVNVIDLQRLINVVLGAPGLGNEDLNRDGSVNVLDVQILINVILGAACPP